VQIDSSAVVNIIPVDPEIGIGNSVIFFCDGSFMNVLESLEELFAQRFDGLQ
jgi:hypothetical protein